MIAHAKAKFIRVTPTKLRQVIDLVRGKDVQTSQAILTQVEKSASTFISNVLNSAVSNARQKGLTEDQLFISKITADQAASWKRFRATAFGRAAGIRKKTSHITIELDLITK